MKALSKEKVKKSKSIEKKSKSIEKENPNSLWRFKKSNLPEIRSNSRTREPSKKSRVQSTTFIKPKELI